MADIRINSLPTTASASSSDDFLALDGATNGTRKLNAYSPTFGGNVTVSGGKVLISYPSSSQARVSFGGAHFDANSSYASYIRGYSSGANTAGLDFYTTYGSSVLALSLSEQGNATLAGNLTVSGTASSFGGFTNAGGAVYVRKDSGEVFRADAAGAGYRIVADQNGVLLGGATTTVGGNLTVSGGTITSGTGTLTLNSSANTVVLQSAGTTALTLDSSQYATFAGGVTVNGGSGLVVQPGSGNTNGAVWIRPSGTAVTSSLNFQNAAGNATQASLTALATTLYFDSATHILRTNGTTALTLDTSQNATFAGAVRINGNVGFYNQAPVAKPTGVAVTAAAIHAALVTLNLISA